MSDSFRLADDANELTIYNVVSRAHGRILHLLVSRSEDPDDRRPPLYRPGKPPVRAVENAQCRTIAELGLSPDRYVCTWPLAGYETKNVVSGEEMRKACAAAP